MRDRGSSMIFVLVATLFVVGVLTQITTTTQPLLREAYQTDASDRAAALAESGIAYARAALRRDAGFTGAELPVGDGRFAVSVRGGAGERVLTSHGRVDATRPAAAAGSTIQRTLEVRLRKDDGRWRVEAWTWR